LQGSRACFTVETVHEADSSTVIAQGCHNVEITGKQVSEDNCVILEETGPLQVDFTPRSGCSFPFEDLGAEAPELPADRFRLEVVAIDGLRAGLEWQLEASAIRWLEDTPAVAALIPAASEPLRLVPDVEVVFPINVLNEAGERVAWDLSQGRVLERRDGAAARELSPSEGEDSWWPVSVKARERSTISLAVGGAELPVVEVVATPVEQARSIEIVAAYVDGWY